MNHWVDHGHWWSKMTHDANAEITTNLGGGFDYCVRCTYDGRTWRAYGVESFERVKEVADQHIEFCARAVTA